MCKQMNKPNGFTLVELIVVILLLGIISVCAASRFSGPASFSTITTQSELLASLRLVQSRAMQRSGYCNRWLLSATEAKQVSPLQLTGACDNSQFDANDASVVNAADSDVSLSLSNDAGNNYLDFDALGRAAQCQSAICTVTLSNTQNGETRQICINKQGYIYGC
ncbi:MSHA biogenesis protein MshC [Vibrio navarrensis]|uniref:Type II secretion system protein H n=2 Tax=Vibrio navarrensis TaxID=29495 RepID=A0A099LPR6_9VIBR|nr:MSHA biogenesis protein MshC [Vibrio navarrensis]MBE4616176.1 MSHA biogenesis protein MshC [Vibrio navarrensis]